MVENHLILHDMHNAEALNALLKVPRHLFDTPEIPALLIEQLKVGEEMVLPFAASSFSQNLIFLTKKKKGGLNEKFIMALRFDQWRVKFENEY